MKIISVNYPKCEEDQLKIDLLVKNYEREMRLSVKEQMCEYRIESCGVIGSGEVYVASFWV